MVNVTPISFSCAVSHPPTAFFIRFRASAAGLSFSSGRRFFSQLLIFGSRAEIRKEEITAVPKLSAPSGMWLRMFPASPRIYRMTLSSRDVPLEKKEVTFSLSRGCTLRGARDASSSSQLCSRPMPDFAVSSRSGSTPATLRSSRRAKAQRISTSMARKQKAILTPMPEHTHRGTRRFWRKPTIGSAAKASSAPSRKGKQSGRRNRAASHTAKNAASTDMVFFTAGRKKIPPFRQKLW